MSQTVATGVVEIRGDDSGLTRTLAQAEAEYKAAMKRIESQSADASLGLDLKEFKAKLKQAEADLKRFNRIRASATATAADKNAAQVQSRLLDNEIVKLKQAVAEREKKVSAAKAENTEARKAASLADAALKREKVIADAHDKWEKQRLVALAKMQTEANRLNKVFDDGAKAREAAATKQQREDLRAAAARQKLMNDIPKMQRQYAQLEDSVRRLRQAQGKSGGSVLVDTQIAENVAKMEALRKSLALVAAKPIVQKVKLESGAAAGVALRNLLSGNQGTATMMAVGIGRDIGRSMGRGVGDGLREFRQKGVLRSLKGFGADLAGSAGRSGLGVLGGVGDAVAKLSTATVRIGPITASIRGAILGLTVLGPVIVDLVGALGSLVSVLGAAALGTGALALGASGLVLSLGGIGLLLKPLLSGFTQLNKLTKAATTATLKYGAGSKQAVAAQAQLNSALKGVSPTTRQAFVGMEQLRLSWGKFVDRARPAFAKDLNSTFKALNADVGTFGNRSVQAFKIASKAWQSWMKGISSPEGKKILGDIMGNANKALGPLLHGLGNLATYFARVAQVASTVLPGLARTFDLWSGKIKGTSEDTQNFTHKILALIQNAKDVGRFFLAAGRFVKAFFAGGVSAGDSFVNTMTTALDRWTAFLNTAQGQNNLHQFFGQAVAGAQALYSALAPLVSTFARWAIQVAPIARAFFSGAGAVTGFVHSILRLTALSTPLTAMATTLGAVWALKRIGAAAGAVGGFTRALLGLTAAERGLAEAQAAVSLTSVTGAGGIGAGRAARTAERAAVNEAGILAGGAAAGRASGQVGLLRKAATLAIPAIAGLGEVAGGIATGGLALVAGAALYGAYKLLTMQSAADKLHGAIQNSLKPLADFGAAVGQGADQTYNAGLAQNTYKDSVNRVVSIKQQLAKLEKTSGKNTAEYKATLDQLNQALVERADTEKRMYDARAAKSTSDAKALEAAGKLQKTTVNLNEAQRQQAKAQGQVDKATNPVDRAMALQKLAAATKLVSDAETANKVRLDALAAAQQQAAINNLNYARGLAGLPAVAGAAAAALGKLYNANQRVARSVATKFADPKDAGKVAAASTSALKGGVSQKTVLKIVADSSSADQAFRRINAQLAGLNAKRAALKLGVTDNASDKIAKIVARVNAMPDGKTKIAAQDAATAKIAAIISRIKGIPDKTARLIARDLISGKTKAAKSLIDSLHDKSIKLTATADTTQLSWAKVILDSLHDKNITITTFAKNIAGATVPHKAKGGRPAPRGLALVGEGKSGRGATEFLADHATGKVHRVDKPTLVDLPSSMAVIPTEMAYRAKGAKLLAEWAKAQGVPGFKGGKPPTSVTTPTHHGHLPKASLNDKGRARVTSDAGKNIKKHGWDSKGGSAANALQKVEDAKNNASDYEFEINRAVGGLTEPSTFLREAGKDDQGNLLYVVDDGAVARWSAQLAEIGAMYQHLQDLITATKAAIANAAKILKNTKDTTGSNISQLQRAITHEKHIEQHGGSRSERQAAKLRRQAYQSTLNDEQQAFDAAVSDYRANQRDLVDQNQYGETTQDNINQYNNDAAAVAGKAASEQQATVPTPTLPDVPVAETPLQAAQSAADVLSTNDVLATIGQGVASTDAQKIAVQQAIIDAAKPLLMDKDKTNDSEANSAIQGAAQVIAGIQQSGAAAATAVVNQVYSDNMNLGTARMDLFKGMGGNFAMAGSIGAVNTAARGLGGRMSGPMISSPSASAPGSTTGNGIVFNQTFLQPPDPHTFSQGVAFELQAAM